MRMFVSLFILTLGINVCQAQENPTPERLRPEQRNELHLKKMAMELDLSDNQKNELAKILAEKSKEREAMRQQNEATKKLSADERFKKRSEMLDKQKTHRDKMKKLLNEKQFAKWENLSKEHRKHRKIKGRKKVNH